MSSILEILKNNFDASFFKTSKEDLLKYGKDWTNFIPPNPLIIIFPKTIFDVQKIVQLANEHHFVLVPSGGRTGLSAGAVAAQNEVVVSMDKMDKILSFNELEQTIQVEAGVITENIKKIAEENNLIFPIDFASKGSSQIGGNIATNAGGIQVVKYGLIRNWVTGLKVVTGRGEILELNQGLIKNATGYDLRHLFIGSEGTLGFIVEATLQFISPPKNKQVILFGHPNIEAVIKTMSTFRKKIDFLAFEFFSDSCVDYVMEHTQVDTPLPQRFPYYSILEFESNDGKNNDIVFQLYQELYQEKIILDDAFGSDSISIKKIWGYRENISASISSFSPYKNDLSVTISNIHLFLLEIEKVVVNHYPLFKILWYGHIADGNLHLNIIKSNDISISEFEKKCKEVNILIFEIVQKYKGSISAEHGVGLLKKSYLEYSKSQEEIFYMKMIKNIFDPNHIMNKGKIFDA